MIKITGTNTYIYETCPWYSVLIDLQTMQIIHEYNLPYVSDFTMYEKDSKYVISTWNAIYLSRPSVFGR